MKQVMSWIAYANRNHVMSKTEIRVALQYQKTKIDVDGLFSEGIFNLCKPLIEVSPNFGLRFVHSTVHE